MLYCYEENVYFNGLFMEVDFVKVLWNLSDIYKSGKFVNETGSTEK